MAEEAKGCFDCTLNCMQAGYDVVPKQVCLQDPMIDRFKKAKIKPTCLRCANQFRLEICARCTRKDA